MLDEFLYQVPWKSANNQAGNHAGSRTGSGLEFISHSQLYQHPDVRHLDLPSSLRDPFGQFLVKRFQQPSSITVTVIADVSASLNAFGKYQQLCRVAKSIAWSAYRNGDRFSFLAGSDSLLDSFYVPPTRHFSSLTDLWQKLAKHKPKGNSIDGLMETETLLNSPRSLIFLLSDFHLPVSKVQQLLQKLEMHDVVPVVFWAEKEYQSLPNWRFAALQDPESGKRRSIFIRPTLQAAIQKKFDQHREAINTCCAKFGRKPLFLQSPFHADQLTDYFLGEGV